MREALLNTTEPELTASRALESLFLKSIGEDWQPLFSAKPNNYLADVAPFAVGQATAILAYANLIHLHVEKLNSLVETHREFLLPYSQTCFNWPVLKSEHPAFSDDEKRILKTLEVGKKSGRFFDGFSKWKPAGTRIGFFVDELLKWADTCKHGPSTKPIYLFGRDQNPLARLYHCDENDCPHPIIARLRKHLVPHEKAAARLKPLSKDSISEWENFVAGIIKACFQDPHSAQFLSRLFVAAKSRKQPKGFSRAETYLVSKVRDRMKALAGVKK